MPFRHVCSLQENIELVRLALENAVPDKCEIEIHVYYSH